MPARSTPTNKRKQSIARVAAAGRRPRGNKFPQLIPEFKRIVEVDRPFIKATRMPRGLTATEQRALGIRARAKLVSRSKRVSQDESKDITSDDATFVARVGVLRSPDDLIHGPDDTDQAPI